MLGIFPTLSHLIFETPLLGGSISHIVDGKTELGFHGQGRFLTLDLILKLLFFSFYQEMNGVHVTARE